LLRSSVYWWSRYCSACGARHRTTKADWPASRGARSAPPCPRTAVRISWRLFRDTNLGPDANRGQFSGRAEHPQDQQQDHHHPDAHEHDGPSIWHAVSPLGRAPAPYSSPRGRFLAYSIGLLINPTSINAESALQDLTAAAHSLGRQTLVLRASSGPEIDKVFASLRELRAGALVVAGDNFFDSRSTQLGALALRHAVPAIYQTREFAIVGGFMSYGANIADYQRRFGVYVGRILQGEKPADPPVQASTKYEFVINLKTARALGIEVPPGPLAIADEVIE
jgi:ABC transporter substrate binding protein